VTVEHTANVSEGDDPDGVLGMANDPDPVHVVLDQQRDALFERGVPERRGDGGLALDPVRQEEVPDRLQDVRDVVALEAAEVGRANVVDELPRLVADRKGRHLSRGKGGGIRCRTCER
jgi:hypothetical protein